MKYTLEQQKEHRKILVDELREGRYKQGVRFLRRNDKYCFEGLACEISGLHKWELYNWTTNSPVKIYGYGGPICVMPKDVMDFYGFQTPNGWYQTKGVPWKDNLTNRNDAGLTFSELADIIEAEPDEMFYK